MSRFETRRPYDHHAKRFLPLPLSKIPYDQLEQLIQEPSEITLARIIYLVCPSLLPHFTHLPPTITLPPIINGCNQLTTPEVNPDFCCHLPRHTPFYIEVTNQRKPSQQKSHQRDILIQAGVSYSFVFRGQFDQARKLIAAAYNHKKQPIFLGDIDFYQTLRHLTNQNRHLMQTEVISILFPTQANSLLTYLRV